MKLRFLKLKDANLMLEWMLDPNCNKYFQFETSKLTLESVQSYINHANIDEFNKHYAIIDDSDEYHGTVSLKNIDTKNHNCEYAISLHLNAMGKGYAKWATSEILKIAFVQLEMNKVYLNVFSDNLRAISLYEKTGFSLEGESKEHIYKNGVYKDLKWYGLLKKNFKFLNNIFL